MKRGDVCRDKVTGCDGCKKNEYIEVVVRCSQGLFFLTSNFNLKLTQMTWKYILKFSSSIIKKQHQVYYAEKMQRNVNTG